MQWLQCGRFVDLLVVETLTFTASYDTEPPASIQLDRTTRISHITPLVYNTKIREQQQAQITSIYYFIVSTLHQVSHWSSNSLLEASLSSSILSTPIMDLATPSAADMGTINAVAATDKPKKVKPERPDDAKYKEALAKAEKAHAINQEKQVRPTPYYDVVTSPSDRKKRSLD